MILTLDWVILHTILHHSSTSTSCEISLKSKKLFVDGWTYIRTYRRTDGRTFETDYIRSTPKSQPKNAAILTKTRMWRLTLTCSSQNAQLQFAHNSLHHITHLYKICSQFYSQMNIMRHTSLLLICRASAHFGQYSFPNYSCWLRGTVVERRSLAGELSLYALDL